MTPNSAKGINITKEPSESQHKPSHHQGAGPPAHIMVEEIKKPTTLTT